MKHEGDDFTSHYWGTWNNLQTIGKVTGMLGNKRASGDHLEYGNIKTGQNTEKSPGDLRKLTDTQTPRKKTIS